MKLTRETHSALRHTTEGVLELLLYCVKDLGFSYLLTGKIHIDALERRFGKFRQLAGSQYLISLRQVFETESKLRLQSLGSLKLVSSKYGEIPVNIEETETESVAISKTFDLPIFAKRINVTDNDVSSVSDVIPLISYIAGYCSFATLKKLDNCVFCKPNLINESVDESDCINSTIEKMDRGGLLYPHPKLVDIVVHIFIIVKKLISNDFEYLFLKVSNQRELVVNLANSVLQEKEIFVSGDGDCPNGHSKSVINKYICRSAANTFLKNYCKDKNDVKNKIKYENKQRKLSTLQK